jgi:hypothetical protein
MSSCSTLKKSLIYSSLAGATTGAYVGKETSPNVESERVNMAVGALSGALLTAGVTYLFYKSEKPDLKDVKIEENKTILKIEEPNIQNDKMTITPTLIPFGNKKYLTFPNGLPKDVKETVKRQYYRKYKTAPVKIEHDGKTYKIPPFEVIETGTEEKKDE